MYIHSYILIYVGRFYYTRDICIYVDAKILKKDQKDIVKPPKVKDDQLLYVHTQEYLSRIQVRVITATYITTIHYVIQ